MTANAASWGRPRTVGLVLYVALTFLLSWIPAWYLRDVWSNGADPIITRLLASSLVYAVVMGWQPFVAVWLVRTRVDTAGYVDHGLSPAAPRFVFWAILAPITLAVVAAVVAWAVGLLGDALPLLGPANTEPELSAQVPSVGLGLALLLAFVMTGALLWAQALGEEFGWRGYFLTRLMQAIGPWRGLAVHGLVWGLWYAPIFLMASGGVGRSLVRSACFVLTCSLLGALLGWLRLASKSILPATLANMLLTMIAGLPYVLQGVDVGARSAAYEPPGWLPMLALLTALVLGRCRRTIVAPGGPRLDDRELSDAWLRLQRSFHHGRDETLH